MLKTDFCELADGNVAICGQTLAAQMNEPEITTARLSNQAAPSPSRTTNCAHRSPFERK